MGGPRTPVRPGRQAPGPGPRYIPRVPRYARALDTALAAARAAADLLRAELFRPGGPRGEPGHCPADGEAEDAIRAILGAAFPDHGFTGEERPERDRPPADPDQHAWVIDPNDGTADFQRRLRGASVSIALIRRGEPVLGVVLAHSAPDGGEDLFAWAEGEGPLSRNGAPVPPLVDGPPGPGDLVLVSSGAAWRALANARATAPARFRPQTSVAYRLALAAAGAARGAISLHRPRGLDVAGGHALLRGAGGALLDQDGAEVRYGRDGAIRLEACFGGPRAAAAALAARAWSDAVSGPVGHPAPRPAPGGLVKDGGLLRRAQGALLGLLAGDALGSLVELEPAARIAARFPGGVRELRDGGAWDTLAGQPTDDSELALALARALAGGATGAVPFDAGRVAEAYADWLRSDPFDVGGTTGAALAPAARLRAAGGSPAAVAQAARDAARVDSQANGALMRVAPLGILGHAARPEAVAAWAREDARLTHPHPVCQDASAVFAATVAFALRTGAPAAEVADEGERLARALGAAGPVQAALAAARAGKRPGFERDIGWVLIALQNAFLQLRAAPSVEEGLVATVGAGGDTDTNAAVAGALLGAVHGAPAIPERWRRAVLSCFPVAGAEGVKRPRPPACWPFDARVLAERLAALAPA